jgi:signal transduction histidine kinase
LEQLFGPTSLSALTKVSAHETVRTLDCQLLAQDSAPIPVLVCAAHGITPDGHSLALVLGEASLNIQLQLDALIIGVVSHELRTPLGVISLAANLLMTDDVTAAQRRVVQRLDSASRHCTRLVGDLLDFTAARGSGIKLLRAERDLHTLAEQALESVRATWPGRDVEHERVGAAASWVDADRVAQIIVNLVNNALQHSPPATKVVVQTRGETDAVVLTVTNQGPPIPSGLMSQLFSPLRRGEDAGQRRGSLGLGLFLVRHLVLAHGGTIDVISNLDDGTRFTIRLPRLPPTAAEA